MKSLRFEAYTHQGTNAVLAGFGHRVLPGVFGRLVPTLFLPRCSAFPNAEAEWEQSLLRRRKLHSQETAALWAFTPLGTTTALAGFAPHSLPGLPPYTRERAA